MVTGEDEVDVDGGDEDGTNEATVVVDLKSTLAQFRKEMGGPFLNKNENRELKVEQRR